MNDRFSMSRAGVVVAAATVFFFAAATANAAILLHFNKTHASPGEVVRVRTALTSIAIPEVESRTGARWHLFLVRADVAAGALKRGMIGVIPVAPLRVNASGIASAEFRTPNVQGGFYTAAIGCRSCRNRNLILGGEHSVSPGRKDVLRIFRRS